MRLVGFYANIWWLDALGGLLLSVVVIFNWSETSLQHIKNLSGFSATADQRNIRKQPPPGPPLPAVCGIQAPLSPPPSPNAPPQCST